MRNWKIKYH